MTVWSDFAYDPRLPENAGLRASDADREVARGALATAYAEGRLTQAEHADRVATVLGSTMLAPITLGDLVGLLRDLVPLAPADQAAAEAAERSTLRAWRRRLVGQSVFFLVPTLACVLLWLFAARHLFWPVWVMVYTGLPLLRTLFHRPAGRRAPVTGRA